MTRPLRSIAVALACIAAPVTAGAQPNAPVSEIAAPPGTTVVREVQAGGVQIYACRSRAPESPAWTLVGPKAILVDADGSDFGTHSAGPRWTATDGSSIVADGAHPLAAVMRAQSVPALLLRVTAASGTGILTPVRFVRRWDTSGGAAPVSGCDAEHADTTVARHYSAIYTFYR